MAQHNSIPSMLQESLVEYLAVADYCVSYRKDENIWGDSGCYGYPSAVLLFAVADAIGSYVLGGSTKNHFNILNHKDYYNLNVSDEDLILLYEDNRCLLTHNASLSLNVGLSVGEGKTDVLEQKDGKLYLNLEPFLYLSKKVVSKFLSDVNNIVNNSQQLRKILNK